MTIQLDERTAGRFLVDTTPWLSCDGCFEAMDTYAEAVVRGTTDDDGRCDNAAMQAHVRGCSACAEELDSLVALLQLP